MNNRYGNRNRGSRYRSGGRNRSRGRNNSNSIDLNKLVKQAVNQKTEEIVHNPSYAFQDLEIAKEVKENIKRKGFTHPTPIQEQAIPHILEGKDLVGIANTGTGKTGAFVIPLIHKILENRDEKVLIIAPTRELAEQIYEEIFFLTKSANLFSVLCVGGMSMSAQMHKLRRSHNFVVGTPGRIKDLNNRGVLKIETFKTIVLDEVDRMLDMGFVQDIKEIISFLPEQRHSLFFSATMTPEIERIMGMLVKDGNFVKVSVKTGETSDNVNQDVIKFKDHQEKITKLEELLTADHVKKVIIFVKTKIGVEKLDDHLYNKGYRVDSLHGNKTQSSRKRALEGFKSGRANILVATDVAARGLDVPNVTHVINYDMPDTYEDYVHRIGRTGRGNQIGHALTFVEAFKFRD